MAQSQEHNEIVSRRNYSSAFSLLLSADLLEVPFIQITVLLTLMLPEPWERMKSQTETVTALKRASKLKHCCTVWLQFWRQRGKKKFMISSISVTLGSWKLKSPMDS